MDASIHHFRCRSGQHVVMRADVRFRVAVAGAELRDVGAGLTTVGMRRASTSIRARSSGPRSPRRSTSPSRPSTWWRARWATPSTPPTRPGRRRCSSAACPAGSGRAGAQAGRAVAHAPPPPAPGARCWASPAPASPTGPSSATARRWPWWCPARRSRSASAPTATSASSAGRAPPTSTPWSTPSSSTTLHRLERRHMGAHDMARVLGYRPGRILVVLSEPHDGYCWKEVAALLPGTLTPPEASLPPMAVEGRRAGPPGRRRRPHGWPPSSCHEDVLAAITEPRHSGQALSSLRSRANPRRRPPRGPGPAHRRNNPRPMRTPAGRRRAMDQPSRSRSPLATELRVVPSTASLTPGGTRSQR